MSEILRRVYAATTTMHGQRALVLFRIVAGCTILSQLLAALPERHFLFGPEGVYPIDDARRTAMFGLFSLVESRWAFEALYFSTIAVTVVWTMGIALPVTTFGVLVMWRSTLDRMPFLGDGGDNLAHLLVIYGLFCNLKGPATKLSRRALPKWFADLRAMVHNTALLAFWIQICTVYFVAGTGKLHGEAWRNGTALYYALSTDRYTIDGLVEPLLTSPLLLTTLAYATVVFQVGFPFMVALNRHSRRVALAIAMTFHLGIASVMGLTTFAFFMIAADLTFLTDAEVSRSAALVRRWWRYACGWFGSPTTKRGTNKERS